MHTNCDYRLSSYQPIVEVATRMTYEGDGWRLWLRHRHYSGLWTDCDADEYRGLTTHELADVLLACVDRWGPWTTHLEPGQTSI